MSKHLFKMEASAAAISISILPARAVP